MAIMEKRLSFLFGGKKEKDLREKVNLNGHVTVTNGVPVTANGHAPAAKTSEPVAGAVLEELEGDKIDARFGGTTIDLVSAALGGSIHSFSDEYFAAATNLLTPGAPIRRKGYYVETGAWFDGWETRRHNQNEFDWVIVKLGVSAGTVTGVEIDTAFFDGNQAPEASVEGVFLLEGEEDKLKDGGAALKWIPILPKVECKPSHRHAWTLSSPTTEKFNYVRLRQYPDGGIARFRLYGTVIPVFVATTLGKAQEPINLAAATLGAIATSCSDQHFGVKSNLLLPGRGKDMGDGWETKRSRGGTHRDWVVIRLACPGTISSLVLDTKDFKGNFPREFKIDAAQVEPGKEPSGENDSEWTEILGVQKGSAHKEHIFGADQLQNVEGKTWTHVRMIILPDGGVKRLKVLGTRSI